MDAILHELDRITGAVESHRAAADRVTIDALRREVADLRRTVAHLRAGAGPLPAHLRPVLARAVLATDPARPLTTAQAAQPPAAGGASPPAGHRHLDAAAPRAHSATPRA